MKNIKQLMVDNRLSHAQFSGRYNILKTHIHKMIKTNYIGEIINDELIYKTPSGLTKRIKRIKKPKYKLPEICKLPKTHIRHEWMIFG